MNESGIVPMGYKILVKPEKVEEKTAGGLYIPETTKDRNKFATDCGVLVAIGSISFTDPSWKAIPDIGARVLYDRYSGSLVRGADGEEYRLMHDQEIGAVITGKTETITS